MKLYTYPAESTGAAELPQVCLGAANYVIEKTDSRSDKKTINELDDL